MMSGHFFFSGGGLIWMLIVGALIVIPFWKLLPRHGIANWIAIFAIIPVIALVLLWIMAFKDSSDGGTA